MRTCFNPQEIRKSDCINDYSNHAISITMVTTRPSAYTSNSNSSSRRIATQSVRLCGKSGIEPAMKIVPKKSSSSSDFSAHVLAEI
ncbi:hypothetical protein PoB_000534500 [Plakobranchus ocellatus]|uniref:Uncharacterized protein n=1 Tax=Plakobranchus ocellatus TaxID=259542 RepID=A0AAV3Y7R9_9GAST|nr:hypothetical protein PoB_000534500 [Plakobranchus ocellatus]